MKLIDNWKKAYRMLSVQVMVVATAIQGTWVLVPEDLKTSIPPTVVQWITMCLLAFGIVGRLIAQPKVQQ